MAGCNIEDGHRITEPMLTKAIANEFRVVEGDVRIKSFDVSGGAATGDNYACIMKAIKVVAYVNGEEKKLNYMAKCIPMSENRADTVKQSGIFTTEVLAYEALLPRLKNLEKCCCTNPVFPRNFYASDDEGVIIMENMKLKGWYMGEKLAGLTDGQLRLLLLQLARLHATSYHFLQTFPKGREAFQKEFSLIARETWVLENDSGSGNLKHTLDQMFSDYHNSFVAIARDLWTGDPSVINKLEAFGTVRRDRVGAIHRLVEDGKGINCILHNDSWCNNFLFKNNADGVLSEAAIVDLQIMKYGRPCIDVAQLLGTSTTPEFRSAHLEEMLGLYHKELSRVLLLHGYDSDALYPFSMFRADFDECFIIGFVMGSLAVQVHLVIPDPETFISEKKAGEEEVQLMRQLRLETVRSDPSLRKRFVAMAQEAVDYGILNGL